MASKTAKTVKKEINEAVDTVDTQAQKATKALRRARLAYLGMYGVAYEEAQARLKLVRNNSDGWFDRLVKKGEEIEAQAGDLFEDTQDRINESAAKVRDAIRPDNVVDIKVKTTKTQKPAAKTARAKKTTVKATVKTAKKPAAKKPAAKKATVKAKKVSKPTIASAMPAKTIEKDERYEGYVSNVRAYDKTASAIIIKKIVDHCGIALTNQDGRFVACSDETERNTVRDSWLKKHLGVTGKADDLDAKVMAICEKMADDRMKDRVTFYFLLAKQEGKLTAI